MGYGWIFARRWFSKARARGRCGFGWLREVAKRCGYVGEIDQVAHALGAHMRARLGAGKQQRGNGGDPAGKHRQQRSPAERRQSKPVGRRADRASAAS